MILADIQLEGRQRSVLMQAPKNGFFYVLDRATGELLSAVPYADVNWATHIDMQTWRPEERPEALWSNNKAGVRPGTADGHNWHPMSYRPQAWDPRSREMVWRITYRRRCLYCHEMGAASSSLRPDLRLADKAAQNNWNAIVLGGSRIDWC